MNKFLLAIFMTFTLLLTPSFAQESLSKSDIDKIIEHIGKNPPKTAPLPPKRPLDFRTPEVVEEVEATPEPMKPVLLPIPGVCMKISDANEFAEGNDFVLLFVTDMGPPLPGKAAIWMNLKKSEVLVFGFNPRAEKACLIFRLMNLSINEEQLRHMFGTWAGLQH